MDRYIRNYFVAAVAGMFCWLNASVVSAQTATNVDCFWCVGPGEVGYNAVPWASLDPSLRQGLQAQQDMLDALQARVDASEGTVLDFTDPDACLIDQPGHYTLDRDWDFRDYDLGLCFAKSQEFQGDEHIQILISADNVIFDLNGFGIFDDYSLEEVTVLKVTGSGATVRNGTILPDDAREARSRALSVTGAGVLIESITAGDINSRGSNGRVRNSQAAYVLLAQGSVLENSHISCGLGSCINALSDTVVRFNEISHGGGTGIRIGGDNVLVEGNIFTLATCCAISIDGDNNIIVRNILQPYEPGGWVDSAIGVSGTGNIIDSNIIKPAFTTGISFRMDGNFYGGNRVSATTPYDLGGTTQTDWGGNVSF